jgi:DtxR family Mn-dependent transcriptional regulator
MDRWIGWLVVFAAGALLGWLGRSVLPRLRRARQLGARSRREDALKHILKCDAEGRPPTLESIAGALQLDTGDAASLLQELDDLGLVSFEEGRLRLRPSGREIALHVVRAHRLWESYLAEQTGVAESEWHHRAERQEHRMTPQEADALAASLGHPTRDPHGDAIPHPHGELADTPAQSLNAAPDDTPVLITHIEDEPETVYAQICAEGLRPGMRALVMERSPRRIRFWADGDEHVLAPVVAENIAVQPLPEFKPQDLLVERYLSGLKPGEHAEVLGLSPACRGPERRRLLDLGFVKGTPVEVEMVSPAGDPTAYRVRGTVVALRRGQANLIRVGPQGAGE